MTLKGYNQTKKHIRKRAEKLIGRKLSKAHASAFSRRGVKRSEETKKKMSETRKGKRTCSIENLDRLVENIRKNQKRKCDKLNLNILKRSQYGLVEKTIPQRDQKSERK